MSARGSWWVCPSCEAEVWAIASEVGHRCPRERRAWVAWVVTHALRLGTLA